MVSCIYVSVVADRGWPVWHTAKQHQKHEDAWKHQQQGRLSMHSAAVYGLFHTNTTTTTLTECCTAQRRRTSSISNAGAAQSTHSFRAYALAKHLSAGSRSFPGKLRCDLFCTDGANICSSLFHLTDFPCLCNRPIFRTRLKAIWLSSCKSCGVSVMLCGAPTQPSRQSWRSIGSKSVHCRARAARCIRSTLCLKPQSLSQIR